MCGKERKCNGVCTDVPFVGEPASLNIFHHLCIYFTYRIALFDFAATRPSAPVLDALAASVEDVFRAENLLAYCIISYTLCFRFSFLSRGTPAVMSQLQQI